MIKKIATLLDKVTTSILIFLVFLMIALSLLAIISRSLSLTMLWIDPLLRHLVFLCTFLGATLAVATDKHIRIDIAPRLIELKNNQALKKAYDCFQLITTLIIVYFLFKAGIEFYKSEVEFGSESFLHIHSSALTGIIPFGFLLIAIRAIVKFFEILRGEQCQS